MKFRRKSGEYPNLLARDVMSGGTVCLWRNPAGQRFEDRDVWEINASWQTTDEIAEAYNEIERQEKKIAKQHSFAWDADFGYLSPNPMHCGTGLHIQGEFHLEALNLIGDLNPVLNGVEAMRFGCHSIQEDGIRDAAHIYRIFNQATLGVAERELLKRAHRLFDDLITQENNARITLVEDSPRIIEDSIARALAILQHARMLAPGELLDLLSPICLGTTMGFLDGITRAETLKLMRAQTDVPAMPANSVEDDRKRDARDAALADRINKRFSKVEFNDYADECLR